MEKVSLHITLESLRKNNACESGYNTLANALGADWPDDKPINLLSCLDSNPVDDVIWALRATLEPCDVVAQLMAADFAESMLNVYESAYACDLRPREAIEAARAFARGEIDSGALAAARDAAWAAAGAAAGAAARAAARCVARAAAGAAAGAVARGVARAAARGVARAAAVDAEKSKQAEIIRKYLK